MSFEVSSKAFRAPVATSFVIYLQDSTKVTDVFLIHMCAWIAVAVECITGHDQ